MKLRLPSLISAAVVALQCTHTANADIIGNGVCYDLGKACYSDDPNITSKLDDVYCWAAGASNIIQYWQDTYKDQADEGITPPNGTNSDYGSPTGTMYLDVYQQAYDCGVPDSLTEKYRSGYPKYLIDWWMKGTEADGHLRNPEGFEGYYNEFFDGREKTYGTFLAVLDEEWVAPTCYGPEPETFRGNTDGVPGGNNAELWVEMSDFIKDAFSEQGRALALNIRTSHIITCWGYETNDEGLVTTLILSDSDDAAFGVFRAQIQIGDSDASYFEDFGMYVSYGERLLLATDDQSSLKYSIGLVPGSGEPSETNGAVWITSFTFIDTPQAAKKVNPDSALPADKAITSNVRITEDKKVEGSGIVVGDTQKAVVLTSERDKTVTLDGQGSNTTGMTVTEGAMVSLSNVEISNYENSGVQSEGKTYFHDGQASLHDNSTEGNGGAVDNTNYLEFLDCEFVSISGNTANGKGGAISNTGGATVSIRGNKEVVFSGNRAAGGANDIYNGEGSHLNIANNDSVTFNGTNGEAAIVNEGNLYLRAEDGKKLTFNNASLDSAKGNTYIGKDILYRDNNTDGYYIYDTNKKNGGKVEFKDSSGSYTSLQANPYGVLSYATLENLTVSAKSIAGAGDNGGIVNNALIASLGGLTMSNLTLNTTDTVESLGTDYIHLDNVAVTLGTGDLEESTFDLTGMFHGNLALTYLTFDLTETPLKGEDLANLTFDLSKAFADRDAMEIYFKTADGTYNLVQAGSQVLLAAAPLPEPTSGTLTLLALAGLCARRRRK